MKYQNGLEYLCQESYSFYILERLIYYTYYAISLVIFNNGALHSMNISLKVEYINYIQMYFIAIVLTTLGGTMLKAQQRDGS